MQGGIRENLFVGLTTLFSVLVVVGNLTYQKFVVLDLSFASFELGVGVLMYPLTFVISDLLAEFYGKRRALLAVKLSVVMNLIVISLIQLYSFLPATSWSAVNDETFNLVFGKFGVAFVASLIACFISQNVDIIIYLFLKKTFKDRFLAFRNFVSTSVALLIDSSVIIGIMCYFEVLPIAKMAELIINSYSYKLFFAMLLSPLFYLVVCVMRRFRL